jgi:ribonuclease HI
MNKVLVINTDGGARGNPGPAGSGAVIRDESGKILYEHKEYLGEATNNFAEYIALIRALEAAAKLGGTHLQINMDSELIVKQMQGSYKIKEPSLQKLAQQVIKLKNSFQSVRFIHVRREFNKDADRLVNEAIDEGLGIAAPSAVI